MKYVDNHAHIQFPEFDNDRDEVIKRAEDAEVTIINIATNVETSKQSIALAEKYENMFAAVGIHPTETEIFDYEEMKKLATHPKVVAIGECGIDLFRNNLDSLNKQIEMFEKHLDLAKEIKKSVMLHLRDSYKEALEVLKKYPDIKANAHFFAGTVDEAKQFLDLGHTISFTGAITYGKNYEEVVKFVPLESILSETDCPFVAPVPYRGKRNEPAYVVEVVKKIAEIKNLPLEQVSNQLLENSKRVWGI